MKSTKTADGFIIRCEIGDEVVSTLTEFAASNGIGSGTVTGIGALKDPELGFYDIYNKRYIKRKFGGDYELVSFSGNIARLGADTIFHCHAAFSNTEFQLIGGHLFSAGVAVTGEFYMRPGGIRIERAPDAATGLNLLRM